MHVVVVRDRLDAVLALGREQQLVRRRAAERCDAMAAQTGERTKARGVRGAHREHLAELVVWHRDS
jgi:hypothetical protein